MAAEVVSNWPKVIKLGIPGGFCAGVDRSVKAYRDLVASHPGRKIYSVGEPAHNPHVIAEFKDTVTFVSDISEVPQEADVIFGPHGHTPEDASQALLKNIDEALPSAADSDPVRDVVFTECPLVTKVKDEIVKYTNEGYTTIYFGQLLKDKNGKNIPHPETRAAMSSGNVRLITSLEEALSDDLYEQIEDPKKVAFATQTTHNADEAIEIANHLLEIFPSMKMPKKEDICFATTNRQNAAKAVIEEGADIIVVVGDKLTSSNTRSLAGVAKDRGAKVFIVNDKEGLDPNDYLGAESVGVVAGASAPGEPIKGIVEFFEKRGSKLINVAAADESRIHFPPPRVQHAYLPQIVWQEK